MAYRGSKIITFRISDEMETEMLKIIENRNAKTKEEPWTRTGFIWAAILEKIAHAKRSRQKRNKADSSKTKSS